MRFRGREPATLAFGTSGLRGLVSDITDLEAYVNTRGFLDYLGGGLATVALAGDLRPSSERIEAAVARAISDAGSRVDYLGKIPTPALLHYALERGLASVMVTGSHIPFDRNGIKFGKPDGEVLKSDEPGILAAVASVRAKVYGEAPSRSPFGDDGMLETPSVPLAVNERGAEEYVERYLSFFPPDSLAGVRVVLFQHSAVGRDLIAALLGKLGADVVPAGRSETFVPIDTEDVSDDRLRELERLAEDAGGGDAVVSTDGDSDRPLVVGLDGGRAHFLSGDLLGVLVARYLEADAVAVPVSANDAVDRTLGDIVVKTRIGSPHVIQAMLESSGETVVGFEANGGFLTGSTIVKDGRSLSALPTRDAILPMVCVLSAARERGVSLERLAAELPPRFGKAGLVDAFPRESSLAILERFDPGGGDAARRELEEIFTPELGFGRLVEIDATDGLRMYFDNGDIAHVRPSGNAPQLRIYAVADTRERADAIVAEALREPDGLLRQLAKKAT